MTEELIQNQIANGSFQNDDISFSMPDIQTQEITCLSTNSTEIENQNSDFPIPQLIQQQTYYDATPVNQANNIAPIQNQNLNNNMRVTRNIDNSEADYLTQLNVIDDEPNRTCCSKCCWFCSNCWCDFENTIFSATSRINSGILKSTRQFQIMRENCLYNMCCSPKNVE